MNNKKQTTDDLKDLHAEFDIEVGIKTKQKLQSEKDIIFPSYINGLRVTTILSDAVNKIDGPETVFIPKTVRVIEQHAFYECENLKEVIFEEGSNLEEIKELAFCDCVNLESITIPKTVTKISAMAFAGCTNLKEVKFEENSKLRRINSQAFSENYNLVDFIFPKSVETLEDNVFYDCFNLTEITIPKTLRFVRPLAFAGSGFKKIIIEEGIKAMDYIFFTSAINLETLVIPATVNKINTETLINLPAIKKYEVAPDSNYFTSINGVLYTKDKQTLVKFPEGLSGVYKVPNGVKRIGELAFTDVRKITRIILPSSIEKVGKNSFVDCENLEIHTSLTSLDNIFEDNWTNNEIKVIYTQEGNSYE